MTVKRSGMTVKGSGITVRYLSLNHLVYKAQIFVLQLCVGQFFLYALTRAEYVFL